MKISLNITLCLLLCLNLFSQEKKCKYKFDKIDDFTKNRKVNTEYSRIYTEGGGGHFAKVLTGMDLNKERFDFFVSAGNYDGVNILKIEIQRTDYGARTNGNTYLFLLSNGDVVTTKIIDQGSMGEKSGYGNSGTWANYTLGVDSLGWAKLKEFEIKKIRVPRDQYNYWDLEIKSKEGDLIKNYIACIESLNIPATYASLEEKKHVISSASTNPSNSQGSGAIPPALIKKWYYRSEINNADGSKSPNEVVREFTANYELITTTQNIVIKGRYEIANNGKMLIWYMPNNPPKVSEIISIDEKNLILKSSEGKVGVWTSE